MLGLGSIIGGASGLVGGLFGGISKRKMMKEQEKLLNAEQADNQSWYDRRYNEDATQRADAQRMLQMTEENIRNRRKQLDGMEKVGGLTQERIAAENSENAKILADTAAQIAVAGANRKDAIESQYMAKKDALNDEIRKVKAGTPSGLDIASNAIGGGASGILKGMGLG